MRFIVASCALLSLCSAAQAGQIRIMGVVANYVTAEDVVDVEIWMDRPLDMRTEWLSFTGGHPYVVDGTFDGPMFGVKNGTASAPIERFDIASWRQVSGSQLDRVVREGVLFAHDEVVRNGVVRHVMSTTLSADELLFDQITAGNNRQFAFKAVIRFVNDRGFWDQDYVSGISTVNAPRLIHSPEPSSLVLIGLAHLIWLPRLRRCFRKRRATVESDGISRHAKVA